jgi:hypothetical protein
MKTPLDQLALRVCADPFFLAAPLARFAESERLGEEALAGRLGCDSLTLTQLRLCRNPDPVAPQFIRDIEQIAGRFGVDADNLAEIVRMGQILLVLAPSPGRENADTPGYLMAARDGDLPETEGEP